MKRPTLFKALLITGLGISAQSFAQNTHFNCGTTEAQQKLESLHPELIPLMRSAEQQMQSARGGNNNTASTNYIIPIVFHIIHDYGPENISDAQILDQMRILNEDYNKLNADTSAVVPEFQNNVANVGIEFRLATKDPDGNCTNGIDRVASVQTYLGNDNSKLNWWPRDRYLNVWVVKDMANGVAGYAYKPPSTPLTLGIIDGIIIRYDYIGSIGTSSVGTSRALTHEIGHYLGLDHPWGPTNQPGVACGDDGVNDTPETKGWTSCNLANPKVCDSTVVENIQNYMEYAYCSKMFTNGQKAVMLQTLNNNIADRNNLWQPDNLVLTGTDVPNANVVCTPNADFHTNYDFVCSGAPVTFFDDSWGATVGSLSWNFGNATPATSTASSQSVTFANPGWQTVSLTATNATGTNSVTKTQSVYVSAPWPNYVGPTTESFENTANVNNEWLTVNRDNNASTWHPIGITGYTGTSSMMINNFGVREGDQDELVSPAYDLQGMTGMTLSFRYAMAAATLDTAEIQDALRIYTSTNCGQTWSLRGSVTKAALITSGYSSNPAFYPTTSNLWALKTITLPSNLNVGNVRFKFVYTNGGHANNLFIDDINISGVVGISPASAEGLSIGIAPNPSNGVSVITLHSAQHATATVDVYDLSGRRVMNVFNGNIMAGENPFVIDAAAAGLSSGAYIIRATVGGQALREKWLISNDKH